MLAADVHYECECRRRWTLSALFYCAACHAVRCPHPSCTCESTEAFVCPSCLFRFHTAEALEFYHRCSKCFECVQCGSRLALRTDTGSDPGSAATSFFSCSHCIWDSTQIGLTADSPDALTKLALDAELHRPVNEFASKLSATVSDKPKSMTTVRQLTADGASGASGSDKGNVARDATATPTSPWLASVADSSATAAVAPIPAELLECDDLSSRPALPTNLTPSSATAPWQTPGTTPIPRIPLLAKCGRRCRACIDAGDPSRRGILLKPNMASFTRDSAPILSGVGASIKWFDKHSSAMEVLPNLSVRVVRPLEGPHGGTPSDGGHQRLLEVLLSVSNPVDADVTVTFAVDASVAGHDGAQVVDVPGDAITLEGFDELAAQDALHMRRRKGGGDDSIPSSPEAGVVEAAGFEALVRVIVAVTGDSGVHEATAASFRVDTQYDEATLLGLSGLSKVPQPALDAKCALQCPVQLTLQPATPPSPLSDLLFLPLIPPADGGGPGRAPGDVRRMAVRVVAEDGKEVEGEGEGEGEIEGVGTAETGDGGDGDGAEESKS